MNDERMNDDRMNDERMDHERVSARLDDFVDGGLSASGRRDVEAHLKGCADCRATVVTRRSLLDEAATLARNIEPERDLWPDIRSRLGSRAAAPVPRRRALAVAAMVALVAATAALTLWLSGTGDATRGVRSTDRARPTNDGDHVTLVADWRFLEREYVGASEELQQTLDELGDELSPETRRIVEENLQVIDEAIAESRAALERDPANRELARALRSAWSSKVEMLQYVTRL